MAMRTTRGGVVAAGCGDEVEAGRAHGLAVLGDGEAAGLGWGSGWQQSKQCGKGKKSEIASRVSVSLLKS